MFPIRNRQRFEYTFYIAIFVKLHIMARYPCI